MENPKYPESIVSRSGKIRKKVGYRYQKQHEDKVWSNFWTPVELKVRFNDLCWNKINMSDFFRRCMIKLLETKGDMSFLDAKKKT